MPRARLVAQTPERRVCAARTIRFDRIEAADLFVDAVYEGERYEHGWRDPLQEMFSAGVQGGFRYKGSMSSGVQLCVLYSSLADLDWPDSIDFAQGLFTYYGDNKKPGHGLHDTKRKGNELLRRSFAWLHSGARELIPPFFVFTKGVRGRDVIFRGLAVPGAHDLGQTEDLVAIWKTANGQRFMNYRAVFTILDVPCVRRAWIDDLVAGEDPGANAPRAWRKWVVAGSYAPLLAPVSRQHRTREEQLPETTEEQGVLQVLIRFLKTHPDREYAFEACAVDIARMIDGNIASCDLTRRWRDGGRDAVGQYRIGTESTNINVDFALEAKCKSAENGSGVRETSRLLSRLRHRQFGVFVTTSYVNTQAYQEIIEDGHPVLILAGRDIAQALIRQGHRTPDEVQKWLRAKYAR